MGKLDNGHCREGGSVARINCKLDNWIIARSYFLTRENIEKYTSLACVFVLVKNVMHSTERIMFS